MIYLGLTWVLKICVARELNGTLRLQPDHMH